MPIDYQESGADFSVRVHFNLAGFEVYVGDKERAMAQPVYSTAGNNARIGEIIVCVFLLCLLVYNATRKLS